MVDRFRWICRLSDTPTLTDTRGDPTAKISAGKTKTPLAFRRSVR
jgi:hypothetical protein